MVVETPVAREEVKKVEEVQPKYHMRTRVRSHAHAHTRSRVRTHGYTSIRPYTHALVRPYARTPIHCNEFHTYAHVQVVEEKEVKNIHVATDDATQQGHDFGCLAHTDKQTDWRTNGQI